MTTQYLPTKSIFKNRGIEWANNSIWIDITPKKIRTADIQKLTYVALDPIPNSITYSFLAPKDFQENINHTWEPLENISATIAQKKASAATIVQQGTNVFKVDTPTLYKDSQRRTVSFLFNLVYTGKYGPFKEVVEPIKNFMKWSTPILPETIIDTRVEVPYVFQVRTKTGEGVPVNIINISAAALTSIQPTYSGPFIDGYPSKAELTLTFTDIEPLNRSISFDRDIRVN